MKPLSRSALGVAEGLLPISILLLGFFIILLASGAFSRTVVVKQPTPLPGIGQVILLRVSGANDMYISRGSGRTAKVTSLEGLSGELGNLTGPGGEEEPMVLVYYDNPWSDFPRGFDRDLTAAVRHAGCRYARAYP